MNELWQRSLDLPVAKNGTTPMFYGGKTLTLGKFSVWNEFKEAPKLIRFWWSSWLGYVTIDQMVSGLNQTDNTAIASFTHMLMLADLFRVLAAASALAMVREIDRRQEKSHAALAAGQVTAHGA